MKAVTLPLALLSALTLTACSDIPELALGQELKPAAEDQIIRDISTLLIDHLSDVYQDEKILRDTHPKDNGCIRGRFTVNSDIAPAYRVGVFQPEAQYPLWMRFSNSVEEITSDKEKDFRGLAMKLSNVTQGTRLPEPGDEHFTQDFLFLGHDAFFAANPQQFFDFFDANFNGSRLWFLATHPRGAWNIFRGAKTYNNPLDVKWNSVVPFALGYPKANSDGNLIYPQVVRYALRSCTTNSGRITESDDYLAENLAQQLKQGSGCLDFYIQRQQDPVKNPVENALYRWDEQQSPLIHIARIDIPSQTFTSEAQKQFCENISFNPWHGIEAHRPLGGINRARQVVMKDISDFRLKMNGVERFEPTGSERF